MTASATETAMRALQAALDATRRLPKARRDLVLDSVFESFAESADATPSALVLRLGDITQLVRRLGAGPQAYEITRAAEIEWLVAGKEDDALATAFDAGVNAIFDAVEIDPRLGGATLRAEINEAPEVGLDAAGAKAVKTALIKVELLYLSPRPY